MPKAVLGAHVGDADEQSEDAALELGGEAEQIENVFAHVGVHIKCDAGAIRGGCPGATGGAARHLNLVPHAPDVHRQSGVGLGHDGTNQSTNQCGFDLPGRTR